MIETILLAVLMSALSEPEKSSIDELVPTAASGNQASLEIIESYHAKLDWKSTCGGTTGRRIGEYWRTGSTVRVQERQPSGIVMDLLHQGGKVNARVTDPKVARSRSSGSSTLTISQEDRRWVETDAWEASLFSLPVSLHSQVPIPTYTVREAVRKGTSKARWEELKGRRVVHLTIDLPDERRTYEVWVDPGYNWLTSKCVHIVRDNANQVVWNNEYEVQEFKEVKPSIFVPVTTSSTTRFRGKLVCETRTAFSDLIINDKIPAIPPMPKLASGSRVVDEVAGLSYAVDTKGRRIGQVSRLNGNYSPPLRVPLLPVESSLRSTYGWIVLLGAVLLAGGGIWVAKRRSKASNHATA